MDERTFVHAVGRRLAADEGRAEGVTFAVFQELRGCLTAKEASDVAAQLPAGLRRLWEEQGRPDPAVARTHGREFIGRVRRRAMLPDDAEAERAVDAVFAELQRLLGSPTGQEGEAWDVFSVLPKELKRRWLTAGAAQP
jgi:uncharacterized protein (DUF2267 family)